MNIFEPVTVKNIIFEFEYLAKVDFIFFELETSREKCIKAIKIISTPT